MFDDVKSVQVAMHGCSSSASLPLPFSTMSGAVEVRSCLRSARCSEHATKTYDIYKHIIEIETAKDLGNVPEMAEYLAAQLIDGGLPASDIEILPVDDTAALIARYRGDGHFHRAF